MTVAAWFSAAGLSLPSDIDSTLMINGFTDNSKDVKKGFAFIALQGTHVDSHRFIADAVENGAALIIAERTPDDMPNVPIIIMRNTRSLVGRLAHAWFGNPTQKMTVIGVTGTNGKTTTTFLLEAVLTAAGYKAGVIGTIEYRFDGIHIHANNTTPGPVALAELFAAMSEHGVDAVAMEVSSHAIDQDRIAGITFVNAIFTNLTQDHLDYHGTMESYAATKERLFLEALPAAEKCGKHISAAFNIDDPVGRKFFSDFYAKKISFAIKTEADLNPTRLKVDTDGLSFMIKGTPIHIHTALVGLFNVSNILGVAASALALGISPKSIEKGINGIAKVPGRFESVPTTLPFSVIVDYSHTPDALQRAIENARMLTKKRVIVVFGCGGDRDKTKRLTMGEIAAKLGDDLVITNDNPRTEDPATIAEMVKEGVLQVRPDMAETHMILDRREAIAFAIGLAAEEDIVLIAGKGHEDYQIIGHETLPFDDKAVASEYLHQREKECL